MSAPVAVLRVAGLAAMVVAAAAIWFLQRADPHLVAWSVPAWVLWTILGIAVALAVIQVITQHGPLHVAALAALAVAATGIRDVQGASTWLAVLLFTFLLACELPHGARRLADLRAGIPDTAGKEARRDLARYTVNYLLSAPAVLLGITLVTILALRLPELVLGGFSPKYVEALETRSVFFVVGVTWLIVTPLLAIRGLWQVRVRLQHDEPVRPENPVRTGASVLDENQHGASDAPLIEVTS